MRTFTLNVTSIVVGVLIARVIILWVLVFKLYVESHVDIDQDQSDKDYENFKKDAVAATVDTGAVGIFIIFITEWYIRHPKKKT
jgi:Ca2+/Na+ antiporter